MVSSMFMLHTRGSGSLSIREALSFNYGNWAWRGIGTRWVLSPQGTCGLYYVPSMPHQGASGTVVLALNRG